METRNKRNRINYEIKAIVIVCDTKEKIVADVIKASPLKMSVKLPRGVQSVLGKAVIIVTEKMIMYADVIMESVNRDLSKNVEARARRFTDTVIESLYNDEKVNAEVEKQYKDVFDIKDDEYPF